MSLVSEARRSITTLLASALGIPGTPSVPANLAPGTFWLRPTRGIAYYDTTGEYATWTRPAINLQAIVAIPSQNFVGAQDWIDDKLEDMIAAIELDPTVGKKISQLVLTEVSEPGLIDNKLLAVAITFRPFNVVGLKIAT